MIYKKINNGSSLQFLTISTTSSHTICICRRRTQFTVKMLKQVSTKIKNSGTSSLKPSICHTFRNNSNTLKLKHFSKNFITHKPSSQDSKHTLRRKLSDPFHSLVVMLCQRIARQFYLKGAMLYVY